MAKKTNVDTIEPMELCEGVYLQEEFFEKKENRVLTLLLKGFIVYLLSMGSIGFYLTAFNIRFQVGLCHAIILLVSLGCAMLYYRLLVENLGYLFLFVSFAFLVLIFRDYINSGFYAIVNITVDQAAQYFDVDVQKLYQEKIGNRYVTVTFVALFIGIVLDILLNVYISRRMQYATAIVIIMSLNLIPLYMKEEPDLLYELMMLAGISMAVVFKAGRHYSPQVSIKRSSRKFAIQGKKKREVSYVYDVKGMIQAGAIAVVTVLFVIVSASSLRPADSFNTGYIENKYKKLSMSAMTTLLVDGLEGFYQRGGNDGGLKSGKLGAVSTVYLDNQTDLVVKMAPYTSNRIFLKSFTGVRYNPYANQWSSMDEIRGYDAIKTSKAEAEALKKSYEQGYAYGSHANMEIQCVDGPADVYRPYYAYEILEGSTDRNYKVSYYPRLDDNQTAVDYDTMPYTDMDLYVPDENIEAVSEAAAAIGTIATNEQAVKRLKEYYQENYPYTIRPGKTPKRKDFVNYFLEENKKGYCSYFASAAVLIFRYMGIPARYVEGYAIDYDQILDGELVKDESYSDYYEGDSELGETACVKVNVTDADAHAWVEIYDSVLGWYPVDVTPSSDEEEDVTNFWDEFADMMGGDDGEADADVTENTNAFTISDQLVRNILFALAGLAGLFVLALIFGYGIKTMLYYIRFAKASYNDKLVMYYSRMTHRYEKKHPDFKTCKNYETQIACMIAHVRNTDEQQTLALQKASVIRILNLAGFSSRKISDEEYRQAVGYIKALIKAAAKK